MLILKVDIEDYGGEGGIRTHVRVSPKHAFQACAFSHSATSPAVLLLFEFIIFGWVGIHRPGSGGADRTEGNGR